MDQPQECYVSEESWTQNSMYKELKSQDNESVPIDTTSAVTPEGEVD